MFKGYLLVEISDPSSAGEYVYQAQIRAKQLPGATSVAAFSSEKWSELRAQLQNVIDAGNQQAAARESFPFHSKFGGSWYDNRDETMVAARLAKISDPQTRERVEFFRRWGYVILENAVPHWAIDKYLDAYRAAAAQPGKLLMNVPFGPMSEAYKAEDTLRPGAKALDTALILQEGDNLSFSLPLSMFLQEIMNGPVLAFQSLHFEVGSTQTVHQDTAYVVIDEEPMNLVASWIALEDVQPGSGELVYYPGGHRIPDFAYDGGASKHFDFGRDGNESHTAHLQYLKDEAAHQGYELRSFLPKKGDALIWHADLPHGGGEITNPGLTRRSLVTHYCPAKLAPHYLQLLSDKTKVRTASGNYMTSMYFPPASLQNG